MLKYLTQLDLKTGKEVIRTTLRGKALLGTPLLNKGTAFSHKEREALRLLGKLPYRVETLEEQLVRAKNQYLRYTNNLKKYIYLNNLHDKNEILFYKLLADNLSETLPKIYTPGVSDAVKEFSQEFRQPRGLYIAYPDRDKIAEIIENRTHAEIDLIVATDGERILGIGDQGIGGIDIPIAKLIVYTVCGLDPYKTLPIMLDVGTDNPTLLNDPAYLGWRHPRVRGQDYDDFIADFVKIVKQKFPKSFLHWEDFAQQHARKILETYREVHCSFNDDMQGTGVVTLAALLSAVQASNSALKDQRIVVFGAGIAGVGIADQLYAALVREGVAPEVAKAQFWLVDRSGLLTQATKDPAFFQKPYLRPASPETLAQNDLLSVVQAVKPTILIGCSTVHNAFSQAVVRAMAAGVERPIIFPLSNPNEKSEAHPENLLLWTQGKALIATGSPFEPVHYQDKIIEIAQCNNAFAFPGIGIGALAAQASQVTDNMLWAAAVALAQHSPARLDPTKPLLPAVTEIPTIARELGLAVAEQARKDGVSGIGAEVNLKTLIASQCWEPVYREIWPA